MYSHIENKTQESFGCIGGTIFPYASSIVVVLHRRNMQVVQQAMISSSKNIANVTWMNSCK